MPGSSSIFFSEPKPIDLARRTGIRYSRQKHSGEGDRPKKIKASVSPGPATDSADHQPFRTPESAPDHVLKPPAAVHSAIWSPTLQHGGRVVRVNDSVVEDSAVALALSKAVMLPKDVTMQPKDLKDTFERTMQRQIEALKGWVTLEGQITKMLEIHNRDIQKIVDDEVKSVVRRKVAVTRAVRLMVAEKELAELKDKAVEAEKEKEAELKKSFEAGYDEAEEAYIAQLRDITDMLYQQGWVDGRLRAVNTPENSPLVQNPPKYPISVSTPLLPC